MSTVAWQSRESWRDIPERMGFDGGAAGKLAAGLGWFSIPLGLSVVTAPGQLARWLGMEGKERLLRAYGLREIGAGAGILATQDPIKRGNWVWGRVAGDALDLATLGAGLSPDNPRRGNVIGALAAVAGV